MKFLNTISVAAVFATTFAVAEHVKLVVESTDESVNGKGLSSLHEGAGINYVFLGDGSQQLEYHRIDRELYFAGGNIRFAFSVQNNVVQLGVSGADEVTFDRHRYLLDNGSGDGFYACKDINDPYGYSKSSYALMNYLGASAPEGCVPVKVRKLEGDQSSSQHHSSHHGGGHHSSHHSGGHHSSHQSGGHHSSHQSGGHHSSHGPYQNATISYTTVTDYTTYCPYPTTVTITTCHRHQCSPTTITVPEPTTITITGECEFPNTNIPCYTCNTTIPNPYPPTLTTTLSCKTCNPGPLPPTTEEPVPPTTEEPAPPTTEEPAPPTTEEPAPPTTEEPAPPTTEEPAPPKTSVAAQSTLPPVSTFEAAAVKNAAGAIAGVAAIAIVLL